MMPVLRRIEDKGTQGIWASPAVCWLARLGPVYYRLQVMAGPELPSTQTLLLPSGPDGWPLDWGRFVVANRLERDEALAALARRLAAERPLRWGGEEIGDGSDGDRA